MSFLKRRSGVLSLIVLIVLQLVSVMALSPSALARPALETYVVMLRGGHQLRPALLHERGHQVMYDFSQAGVMVVRSRNKADLVRLYGAENVARDQKRISLPKDELAHVTRTSSAKGSSCASTTKMCAQQWDLERMHVSEAWRVTQGSPRIKVAVLDTGLNSHHEEVGANYDRSLSRSFVVPTESCPADMNTYGSTEDYNGHGTWTNLHIAGMNGKQMTGVAPKTTLINIRVLGACGFGYDSWILAGMLYAHAVGARIISMSLGGYVCADGVIKESFYCDTADKVADSIIMWHMYQLIVNYLTDHGTTVIAAAGNEHVQVEYNGLISSAGSLAFSAPYRDPSNSLLGTRLIPGGLTGVVTVAATNRISGVADVSESKFIQYGAGLRDQLAYYSNYGQRIDVSAPGGARNYNLPRFDCFSDACVRLDPSQINASDNPGNFGAWAFDEIGNPCNNCYVNIQGTSMATPEVAGVAALALATHPRLNAWQLKQWLKFAVSSFQDVNATPPVSASPEQVTYNYDMDYAADGISNTMMGTGVIDAALAVR